MSGVQADFFRTLQLLRSSFGNPSAPVLPVPRTIDDAETHILRAMRKALLIEGFLRRDVPVYPNEALRGRSPTPSPESVGPLRDTTFPGM